uniref:HDOD domain-containing protein n=1 Tax=Panagrellus redivivus TaxID=6233 RepID=A0A7E4VTU7_PANRE
MTDIFSVPCASPPVCDLIASLIQLNPKNRITAVECAEIIEKTWSVSTEINYTPLLPGAKRGDPGEIAFATELDYDGALNGLLEMSL